METPKKKKRKTCSTKVVESLQNGDSKKKMRTKVICVSSQKMIKDSIFKKKLLKTFHKLSRHTGSYRYLIGLLSNFIFIRKLEQSLDLPKINKTLYDKCWASLDFIKGGKSRKNEFYDITIEFIERSGFNINYFPDFIGFAERQSVTNEMETTSKSYILLNMENKIKSFIYMELEKIDCFKEMESKYKPVTVRKVLKESLYDVDNTVTEDLIKYYVLIESIRKFTKKIWVNFQDKPLKYILKVKPESFLGLLKFISDNSPVNSKSSLLPIWELKPTLLYYSNTVTKSVFNKTVLDFASETFNLERVNSKGYILNGFRTDGYQIQLSYVSTETLKPFSKNTGTLNKAGYQFPKSKFSLSEEKGIFMMHQERMDVPKVNISEIPFLTLTCIDPGCSEVVSVRKCKLESCKTPKAIIENSDVWNLSGKEYSESSGRFLSYNREELRRRNVKYRKALEEFKDVTKKSSDSVTFLNYLGAVSRSFKVLYSEKTKSARKRTRLQTSRMVQSTIDKLSSRICKHKEFGKNIVLFGNGSFSAKRGHASAPRKKLVRSLGSKSIVGILDEFRTSKRCPGGCFQDMMDVEGSIKRLRQCSIDNSNVCSESCSLFQNGSSFRIDRDEGSTINFCRIGYESLVNSSWPEYLLRDF